MDFFVLNTQLKVTHNNVLLIHFSFPTKNPYREAVLAEMGVALREDGGTIGVFSPKKVSCIFLWTNSHY